MIYENKKFWDTHLNKSDEFLLDPFYIYNIYAMFWFVFSVKNYTNKILFKLRNMPDSYTATEMMRKIMDCKTVDSRYLNLTYLE